MWPFVSLVESDCRILWSSVSLERIKWYLSWFVRSLSPREGRIRDHNFWLGMAACIFLPVRFFYHQYTWKKSSGILVLMLEVSHQRGITPETITFGWMWLVVPLVESDCTILWSSISWEKVIRDLSIFCMKIVIKRR